MYPEFDNEIKDVSANPSAEEATAEAAEKDETASDIDIAEPGDAEETSEAKDEVPEDEPEAVSDEISDEESSLSDSEESGEEETAEPEEAVAESEEAIAESEEGTPAEAEEAVAEPEEEQPSKASDNENYLLFGGKEAPEGVDYEATRRFLAEQLKYDGGELRQARRHKDGSGVVTPEEKATEFCAYCGLPISGVDYYRLPDGRKRCTNCNRSLVKSLDELNAIFNEVVLNMELFFGAVIDVPIAVEMIEERKLKKKIGKGLGNPPKNVLILGVAIERKGKYTVYIENGIPRASLIATLAHELTHIWQYTHWSVKNIKKKYGSKMRLIVYEGMAMWTEIQYLYHIGEATIASREELNTLAREDEYGVGFAQYVDLYPLNKEVKAFIDTPFSAGEAPLG